MLPRGPRLGCGALKKDPFPRLRAPAASRSCWAASLKAAALESSDVVVVERKPFSVAALGGEPRMPVTFDPFRVIGLDDVNRTRFFWELNLHLAGAPANRIGPADLVMATCL